MHAEVVQIGDGLGIVLPPEIVASLKVEAGDWLELSETKGGYMLAKADSEFSRAMKIAREITVRY